MTDANFRPTILVGVGGTGCKIAEQVYTRALQSPEGQAGKIIVMGFDTDLNDMERLKSIQRNYRFRFSSQDRIRTIIHKYQNVIEDFMVPAEELPQRILNMTLVEGAGQIRMFSHLGLFTNLTSNEIQQRVGNAFAELGRMDNTPDYQGIVNVMMVGSLAGATGSGSFVQIASALQDAAETRKVVADVRGVFLMPDVYVNGASMPTDQIPNILANGYSSLKELNAANIVAEDKEKNLRFTYEFGPGRRIGKAKFPFASMSLIDFESSEGRTLGRSLDSYMGMCERAVFQQLFSPIGGKMRSKEVNDARSKLAAAASGSDNIYSGLGVSAIVYPIDAVADYLTNKFALEKLAGDWLRLDRQFSERMRSFKDQRASGNLMSKEPERSKVYLEDLRSLATTDRNAFFVDIYDKLNPVKENDQGVETREPQHISFLDAIVKKVTDDFWDSRDLETTRKRSNLSGENLANLASLQGDVRDLERGLDSDLNLVEEQVRDRPRDILTNTLSLGDDMGEQQWSDYHIQSYIMKGGPHVVQVRAFLYALIEEIAERLGRLTPRETRDQLIGMSGRFEKERDRARTHRSSPETLEAAAEASKGGGILGKIRGNSGGDFVEEYVSYYNRSIRLTRQYADQEIEFRVLTELEKEARALERVVNGLFLEVDSLIKELTKTCDDAEVAHDAQAASDGNYWVNSSRAAKQAMWQSLSTQLSGMQDETAVNHELTGAIYRKYREDKRKDRETGFDEIKRIFRETLVDQFAKKRVQEDTRQSFDMTVIEALQADCERDGSDWRAKLRDMVGIIGAQSEPLLALTDAKLDGQRVMYWAVNPKLKEQIADDGLFSEMFTLNQGEEPVVLEEFSTTELVCINSRLNLELNHLAKLSPLEEIMGVSGMKGRYFAAYETMIQALIHGDKGSFTPHIHKDWHLPGVLPEIDESVSAKHFSDMHRAFVAAVGTGVLTIKDKYGQKSAVYSTHNKRDVGGLDDEISTKTDWFDVLGDFEKRADIAKDALDFWNEYSTKRVDPKGLPVESATESAAYLGMTSPETLGRILELSVTRINSEERDAKVISLVGAWASLVRDVVDDAHPDQALVGRAKETERMIAKVRADALDQLRPHVRSETIDDIEKALSKGIEIYRQMQRA